MPDDVKLRIERRQGIPSRRVISHYAPIGGMVEYTSHNNNLHNAVRAVLGRVLFVKDGKGGLQPPPAPTKNFVKTVSSFHKRLRKFLPLPTKWTAIEFAHSYECRKKRNRYLDAAESLVDAPLKRADAKIRAFLKNEKIKMEKRSSDPRLIQPRSPRFNVELGRYLRPIEHSIYTSINKVYRSTVVFKGMNAVDQGRVIARHWRAFKSPVAIGFDASRFDQHVRIEALMYEHSVYKQIYRKDRYLAWLLSMQLRNSGSISTPDGKIRYTTNGNRMSGDMNTAAGNIIINCAMIYAYINECGLTKSRLINNGDRKSVV